MEDIVYLSMGRIIKFVSIILKILNLQLYEKLQIFFPTHIANISFVEFEWAGGFGSYLFGMSDVVAKQSSETTNAHDIKNPALGWMLGFIFVVSFLGLFSVVPLRKVTY